jgi:hypothetical protein
MEGQAVPEPADVFPSSTELTLFVAQKNGGMPRKDETCRSKIALSSVHQPTESPRLLNAISDGLTTESNDSRRKSRLDSFVQVSLQ